MNMTALNWPSGHGIYDDKVLFDQQNYGIQKLEDMGVVALESNQYVNLQRN
jgi:hypothetical protein